MLKLLILVLGVFAVWQSQGWARDCTTDYECPYGQVCRCASPEGYCVKDLSSCCSREN